MVVRGPRQVGKTTIINIFGKSFDNYLYINLERHADRELVEAELPTKQLVTLLFARKGLVQKPGNTLLFFDEIQNSPEAIAKLRYFYEDCPELHIVAAGSLLENIIDVKASFPVGRVDYLPVRPCSFCEFMTAIGKGNQLEIMRHPELTKPFHEEYMSLFNQYCVIGGMPEAVQKYADTGDLLAADSVYRRLLQGYIDDVEKYATNGKASEVVRFIIRNGWGLAGSIVTMTGFGGSDYKSREIGEAFQLLQKTMLLELVYPSTSPKLPVLPELRRMPKLFWMDTGMVNYVAQIRKQVIASNDISDVWKGRIGEQIVAQELLTLNNDITQRRSFWTRGKGENGAEVDLTWVVDSQLIPIEVRNGHNAHLRSLHSFIDASPCDKAVRVWSGPFSIDEPITVNGGKRFRLYNIPYYLVWSLEDILREN